MIALSPANHNDYLRTEGKNKNELELSKQKDVSSAQLGFERGESLGVLQSRREVAPDHWSSRLEGARTIASLAGIAMIARDSQR